MTKITWHNGEIPSSLKIRQVYGIIFTSDGRLLLIGVNKSYGKKYSFAGGTPEDYDLNMVETLKRELIEEVNTTIKEPILVGYQEIDEENGKEKYAQVRMVALIDKIGPRQEDPATGETFERILTSPNRAIELLNWGEVGKLQINEAVKIAKEQLGLTTFINKEELI